MIRATTLLNSGFCMHPDKPPVLHLMEETFCRVCRGSNEPLCHPCRCSGSMKYVHQKCLELWLGHSGKSVCEICGYKFNFVPVYSESAPEQLPWSFVAYHLTQKLVSRCKFYLRFILSAVVWLVFVPSAILWIWRIYFDPVLLWEWLSIHFLGSNSQKFARIWTMDWNQIGNTLFADVFEGQILCSIGIIVGLMVICLKEVIAINVPRHEPEVQLQPEEDRRETFRRALEQVHLIRQRREQEELTNVQQRQYEQSASLGQQRNIQLHAQNQPAKDKYELKEDQEDSEEKEQESKKEKENWRRFVRIEKEPLLQRKSEEEFQDKNRLNLQKLKRARRTLLENKRKLLAQKQAAKEGELKEYELDFLDSEVQKEPQKGKRKINLQTRRRFVSLREEEQLQDRYWLHVEQLERSHRSLMEHERNAQWQQNHGVNTYIRPPRQRVNQEEAEITLIEQRANRETADSIRVEPRLNQEAVANMVQNVLEVPEQEEPVDVNVEVRRQGELNAFFELVGIAGPIKNLFVSSSLVVVIALLAIGFGVWFPYALGKVAFVFVNDYYMPAVDFLVKLVLDRLFLIIEWFLPSASQYLKQKSLPEMGSILKEMYKANSTFGGMGIFNRSMWKWNSGISGEVVYSIPWTGIPDKILLVVIGYLCTMMTFWVYYRTQIMHSPYYKSSKQVMLRWAKYGYLGIKFSMFMLLELAVFPVYCGILIDVCTLSLFGCNSTIQSRKSSYRGYTMTFLFLHWLVGTAFMFLFAAYVSWIREIVRRGVLWFVRDPNDPHYQPIQEIFERPVLTQLRKLAISTLLYSIIVFAGIGCFVVSLYLWDYILLPLSILSNVKNRPIPAGKYFGTPNGPFRILPLNWEFTHNSISDFPVDLLVFHFVAPKFLSYLQPKSRFKRLLRKWFVFSAALFRLSDFLLGDARPEEECDAADREYRYMRVPNTDYIDIVPGQKVLVPLRKGDPIPGAPGETSERINEIWTKVYVPAYFKTRIRLLLIWHWLSVVMVFSTLFVVPLVIGRFVFAKSWPLLRINSRDLNLFYRSDLNVHDTYSWCIGFGTLLIIYSVLVLMQSLAHKTWQADRNQKDQTVPAKFKRRIGGLTKSSFDMLEFGLVLLHENLGFIAKAAYLFVTVGCLIPVLVAYQVEQVVHSSVDQSMLSLHCFLQNWFSGLLYTRLMIVIIQTLPPNSMQQAINTAFEVGLRQCNALDLTRKVLGPLIGMLSSGILVPASIHKIGQILDGFGNEVWKYGILSLLLIPFGGYLFAGQGSVMLRRWINQIRDEHYMVGRELENIE